MEITALSVINECWGTLGPEALALRVMSGKTAKPTTTSRKALFNKVFLQLESSTLRNNETIDRLAADLIRSDFELQRATLEATPQWYLPLLEAHESWISDGHNPIGSEPKRILLGDAFDLATRYPGPLGEDERLSLARHHLAERVGEKGELTMSTLRKALGDQAIREHLEKLLDDTWLTRPPEPEGPPASVQSNFPLRETMRGILNGAHVADKLTSVNESAESHWKIAMEQELVDTAWSSSQLGLSSTAAVRKPTLDEVPTARRQETVMEVFIPLDNSLLARFSRMTAGESGKYLAGVSAVQAWQHAIAASALPLGVGDRGARLTLALGLDAIAAAGTTGSFVSVADREKFVEGLSAASRILFRKWQNIRVVQKLRRLGELPEQADNYLTDPLYYLGRLWTRVYRSTFTAEPIDSADRAWSHIHGAGVSTAKQVDTVLKRSGGGPGPGPVEDPETAEQQALKYLDRISLSVRKWTISILGSITTTGNESEALEFLLEVAKARKPDPEHTKAMKAQWDQHCLTFLLQSPTHRDAVTGKRVTTQLDDLPGYSQVVPVIRELVDERFGAVAKTLEEHDEDDDGAA